MSTQTQTSKELTFFMQNIKKLREENYYTKKEMAKRLKISTSTLNKIENGEFPPRLTIEILETINKKFGISPADMFKENTAIL